MLSSPQNERVEDADQEAARCLATTKTAPSSRATPEVAGTPSTQNRGNDSRLTAKAEEGRGCDVGNADASPVLGPDDNSVAKIARAVEQAGINLLRKRRSPRVAALSSDAVAKEALSSAHLKQKEQRVAQQKGRVGAVPTDDLRSEDCEANDEQLDVMESAQTAVMDGDSPSKSNYWQSPVTADRLSDEDEAGDFLGCTVCGKERTAAELRSHPLLKVAVCRTCLRTFRHRSFRIVSINVQLFTTA